MAGSAFLVFSEEKIWLVTCVHNITMMRDTPTSALDPQSLIDVIGTSLTIAVFRDRMPGFACKGNSSILWDCMSIRLTTAEANALVSFGAFHLADLAPATMNSAVTFTGFPGLTTLPIAASSVQGRVSQVTGASIAVDQPARPGFSGGPLYTDAGLLGVMRGDIGFAPNYTSGLAISLDLFRNNLFP